MEIQYKIILIWIAFSLISGIAEAFYFSKNQRHVKVLGLNIHTWFTFVRSVVTIPLVVSMMSYVCVLDGFTTSVLVGLLFTIIMMLIFPFLHDGVYYTTRELLKKGTYPLYWLDQSEETDAKNSFNIVIRVLFLIIALIAFPY